MVRSAPFALVLPLVALALAGCTTPPAPTAQACDALESRLPAANAPLIATLRGEPEDILATLVAALGDAAAGPATRTLTDTHETSKVATILGGEAWVTSDRNGRFAGFGYEADGHGQGFTEANAASVLARLTQALGLQDWEVKTEAGPTHNSFGTSVITEASIEQRLGPYPVSREPAWRTGSALFSDMHWDLPMDAAVRLWWDSYGQPGSLSHFNETRIGVDAFVELPPLDSLASRAHATETAESWVQCRLANTWLAGSPVTAYAPDEALRALEDSLGYVVEVDYGPECPGAAWNPGGRQWEMTVIVDATSDAILKAGPGEWNCIGLVSPHGAGLGLDPNDERGGGLGTPATKDPHIL